MKLPAIALIALAAGQGVAGHSPTSADRIARDRLHFTRYRTAQADLNGDGRAEVLIFAEGPEHCGSGGCDLYVFTPCGRDYAMVADVSVTRPPIRVLPTSTHGWRDLAVFVAGGGIRPGYTARLRFDGRRYPGNPTVPPAQPMKVSSGRVVIRN